MICLFYVMENILTLHIPTYYLKSTFESWHGDGYVSALPIVDAGGEHVCVGDEELTHLCTQVGARLGQHE